MKLLKLSDWNHEGDRVEKKCPVDIFNEGPTCRVGIPAAQRATAGSEWSRGKN